MSACQMSASGSSLLVSLLVGHKFYVKVHRIPETWKRNDRFISFYEKTKMTSGPSYLIVETN